MRESLRIVSDAQGFHIVQGDEALAGPFFTRAQAEAYLCGWTDKDVSARVTLGELARFAISLGVLGAVIFSIAAVIVQNAPAIAAGGVVLFLLLMLVGL